MTGNTAMTAEQIVTGFATFAFLIAAITFVLINGNISVVALLAGVGIATALIPIGITLWVFLG